MLPLDCLQRYPLFDLLGPHQLDAWLRGGEEQTVATGETVVQEGASGIWAYLVLEGRVRVLRRSGSKRDVSLGQFGPGEIFGEYALLLPNRYTATCRAASEVRLLRLSLLHLRRVLATSGLTRLKDWLRLHALVTFLRGQTFLGFMSAPSALRFLDSLQPATFQPEQTIQAEGLAAERWCFIESGQVRLAPSDAPAADPSRVLGPGDSFGAAALHGEEHLPIATAVTETRCQCLTRVVFAGEPDRSQSMSVQSLEPRLPSLCEAYVWVAQQEPADCGLAALAMIARFYGLDVTVARLRQDIHLGPQGASVTDLQRLASSIGLRAVAVRVQPEQLEQVTPPAIVHWAKGHYVVLYELGSSGVAVGDPASGLVRLSAERFAQSCSGTILLVRR